MFSNLIIIVYLWLSNKFSQKVSIPYKPWVCLQQEKSRHVFRDCQFGLTQHKGSIIVSMCHVSLGEQVQMEMKFPSFISSFHILN